MMRLVVLIVWTTVLALIVTALTPSVPTDHWVVRMADFPRLQFLIGATFVALVAALLGRRRWSLRVAAVLAAGVSVFHAATLWPWVIGGRPTADCPLGADRLRVLVANVRMTNDPDSRLAEMVRKTRPDLFLALETNTDWAEALATLNSQLPHVVDQPASDYYGIMLMSRLPLMDARVVYPGGEGTPSIVATVALEFGAKVVFQGLHPRPPHPGQSAASRDAQILAVAASLAEEDEFVLAGDLNATPWETTIRTAAGIAGWEHPRLSFGYAASYSARSLWRRWPLDYILPSAEWSTTDLEVLPAFGSDHYPLLADLCRKAQER